MTKAAQAPRRKLQAFVIDDSRDMRELLRRMLEEMSIICTDFRSAERALAALTNGTPDIIFVDLKMSPMDGLAFTRAVRGWADPHIRTVPIIMVSGFAERSTIEAARHAGVTEFLAKPVSPSTLRARPAFVLQQQKNVAALPQPARPNATKTPAEPEEDLWLI